MSKKVNIADIISGCQQGDPVYQRALVDNYSALLFSVSIRYMGDETKAKDILQESFIRIFKSFNTFDPSRGTLGGWMRKITVNVALRSLGKRRLETSNLSVEHQNKISVDPKVVSKLGVDELMAIIKTLPDGYRQVFNLSVIEGYSHKEIGAQLGIAEVSSRSNLSRAKQLLRKKLQELQNSESWIKAI